MSLVLNSSYLFTNNYGLSIILLSLVVNIAILPLYYMADRWKISDQNIQAKMKPEIDSIKKHYKGQERHYYIQALYKIYNYHPLSSVKASAGFLIQIPFFFAAFHLLSNFEALNGVSFFIIDDLGKADGLLGGVNILPFIMTIVNLVSAFVYTKLSTTSEKAQLIGMALLFLVLLYTSPAGLLIYWTFNNIFSLFKNIFDHSAKVKLVVDNFKEYLEERFKAISKLKNYNQNSSSSEFLSIYMLSTFLILVILLLVNPINLYNSSSEFLLDIYNSSFKSISYITLALISLYLIYLTLTNIVKKILSIAVLYLATTTILYSFIIEIDYGLMDHFIFNVPSNLLLSNFQIFLEILFLISLLFILIKLFTKYKKYLYITLLITFLSLTVFIVKNLYSYSLKDNTSSIELDLEESMKKETNTTLSFSKDKNIIIFMLDGYSGGQIYEIIKNSPRLFDKFDGFVSYKNTLTTGTATWGSISALAAGHNYTIDAINSRDREIQIDIDEAYTLYPKSFLDYQFSYLKPQYLSSNSVLNDLGVHISNLDIYSNFASQSGDNIYGDLDLKQLYMISFFKIVPLFAKNYIYNDGLWHGANSESKQVADAIEYKKGIWTFMKILTTKANFDNSKSSFKFFQLNMPHVPYAVDMDGELNPRKSSYKIEAYKVLEQISKLIDLFKSNGVYDSSKIVIVSDHGWWMDNGYFNKEFSKHIKEGAENRMNVGMVQPLMLIKEFNSKEKFRVSDEFMSNADLASIICSSLQSRCGIADIDPRGKNLDRELSITTSRFDGGEKEGITKNQFIIKEKYIVKETIFDYKNWKKDSN
jgi:YidC/Oxa1 family membrane protein insertase